MVCSVNPEGARSAGGAGGVAPASGTGVGGVARARSCVTWGGGGEVGHGSPGVGEDGRFPAASCACSAFLLHPAMSSTPSKTKWTARMAKTVMRTWDLPLSGKVPWGTSGLGVFILKSGATQRPFSRFYSVHVVRREVFPQKTPRQRPGKSYDSYDLSARNLSDGS